jgi:hypothetical protein
LDGNKKWQANAETTQGIQSMIVLTDAYLANPSPDLNLIERKSDVRANSYFSEVHHEG